MKKTFKHSQFTAVFTDESGYFSLTGEVDGASGAVGDSIAKIDSRFELLNKVHLADCKTGVPMHAFANARYFLGNDKEDSLGGAQRSLALPDTLFERWAKAEREIQAVKAILDDLHYDYQDLVGTPELDALDDIEEEIIDYWKNRVQDVYKLVEEIPANLTDNYQEPTQEQLDEFSEPEKAKAVAMHENVDIENVTEIDDTTYQCCGEDYLVLDEDEADDAWENELDSYLEECVLPELPESVQGYFNEEAWKRDARMDGRGHALSRYDGHEHFENGYYLYKQ